MPDRHVATPIKAPPARPPAASNPADSAPERISKARIWRERAARYRALAKVSFKAEARQSLLRLAEDCERYAERAKAQPNKDL